MTSTETDGERRTLLAVLRLERWDLDRLLEERVKSPAQLLSERQALLNRMPIWPGDETERNGLERQTAIPGRGSDDPAARSRVAGPAADPEGPRLAG